MARKEHGSVPRKEHGSVPRKEHGSVPRKEHGSVPRKEHGSMPLDIPHYPITKFRTFTHTYIDTYIHDCRYIP